jgi:hypothetical protein
LKIAKRNKRKKKHFGVFKIKVGSSDWIFNNYVHDLFVLYPFTFIKHLKLDLIPGVVYWKYKTIKDDNDIKRKVG